MRWSKEQVAAYEARRLGRMGTLDADRLPAASREQAAARSSAPPRARAPREGSKLEAELLGHLSLMGLKPEQQFKFHPERRWRLDIAFSAIKVAVEIDGDIFGAENGTTVGKHSRGAGRCKDMEKRNAAAELGWIVLNYGPPHIRSGEAALQIQRIVQCRTASESSSTG